LWGNSENTPSKSFLRISSLIKNQLSLTKNPLNLEYQYIPSVPECLAIGIYKILFSRYCFPPQLVNGVTGQNIFEPVATGRRFSLIVELLDRDGVGYIKGAKTQ
jgi:hypothetical protein